MFYKINIILILGALLIGVTGFGIIDSSAAEKKYSIVLDPAHGGDDPGVKITDKIGEKDITLAIALALQKELSKEGNFEIILTRDSDKSINISDRRKNIFKIKPDIFLSLHVNSGFGKYASGFELYFPGFKDSGDHQKLDKIGLKDTGKNYLNNSVRLAKIIQKNMDMLFPHKGRGLREADLMILEGMSIPAAVVEISFASNADEKKMILSEKSQAEIAKTLARSIKSFLGDA
jgi:N-acetylmuramoyl-L-alanine amidase